MDALHDAIGTPGSIKERESERDHDNKHANKHADPGRHVTYICIFVYGNVNGNTRAAAKANIARERAANNKDKVLEIGRGAQSDDKDNVREANVLIDSNVCEEKGPGGRAWSNEQASDTLLGPWGNKAHLAIGPYTSPLGTVKSRTPIKGNTVMVSAASLSRRTDWMRSRLHAVRGNREWAQMQQTTIVGST